MKRATIHLAGALLVVLPIIASELNGGLALAPQMAAVFFTQSSTDGPRALSRRDVDRLLAQARVAIKNGRLDEAEALIVKAERSGQTYGIFQVGNSPKKARRALTKARKAASQQGPSRKNPFDRALFGPPAPVTTAVAVGGETAEATSYVPPKPEDRTPIEQPLPPVALSTPANDNQLRANSDSNIRSARLALAVGDVRRAKSFLGEAKKQGVRYQFADDSPARVEASIVKYEQVLKNQAALKSNPAWKNHYARVLLEQAEALFLWKEWDEAERLALDSQRLGGQRGPYEADPQTLLGRIESARRAQLTGNAVPVGSPAAPPANEMPSVEFPDRAGGTLAGSPSVSPAVSPGALAPTFDATRPPFDGKAKTLLLLSQARAALAGGDISRAEALAAEASELNVAETAFGQGEDRLSSVALAIHAARMQASQSATTESGPVKPASTVPGDGPLAITPSLYQPEFDTTRNIPAIANSDGRNDSKTIVRLAQTTSAPAPAPAPLPLAPNAAPVQNDAERLLAAGEAALRAQKIDAALQSFRQAYERREQLDPLAQQRLQGHLQMLSAKSSATLPTPNGGSLIDVASDREKLFIRQLSADLTKLQTDARRLRDSEPTKALEMLRRARTTIETASIRAAARSQLLRRVDVSISEVESFIEQNRAQLELDEQNRATKEEIDRGRRVKVQVQEKVAQLVDQFNKLRNEQRYAEMEVIARRLHELAPDEPVAKQVYLEAKSLSRMVRNQRVQDAKEEGNWLAWDRNESASIMPDPDTPFHHNMSAEQWGNLSATRARGLRRERRRTESELEIERRLKMPVQLRYTEQPLAQVIEGLGQLSGVNIHLDPLGLNQEAVRTDTPVTINLQNEISLESALNLILEPLHLGYVVKDEVLKITSEGLREGEVYTEVYDVADLVIPIPNFAPSNTIGLQGLINDAHAAMGYGYGGLGMPGPMAFAANDRRHGARNGEDVDGNVLAQQMSGLPAGLGGGGRNVPIGGGPGGLGGGSQADFDALIELITSTVNVESWEEAGGPGSIREFATNLSLVVSQTQEVHEQIADLLEQLRRLQDLQVTIEVRYITLNDRFFERIGIDFDFNIEDGPGRISGVTPGQPVEGRHSSTTVGLNTPAGDLGFPNFTADLDLPFRNDSVSLAVSPDFGSPVDVASFGFAILSDIEAYFIINAAQGDRRSNILEAPKVTLFNGQQAFVSDTVQRPFVISVIPVVGDFAAAQQPVIVVLSEGTFMTIQAVVSNDRRYVRLTVVPFFSQINNVTEFTFEGSTTSASSSSSTNSDDDTDPEEESSAASEIRSGTTVQLPEFAFVSVSTTVSVPDGGTVLLGGIKRLAEGRNEFGVPLLSKVPYINRLFRNVGIGRSTETLMMMVTPRIIIQEEEEERLGIVNE